MRKLTEYLHTSSLFLFCLIEASWRKLRYVDFFFFFFRNGFRNHRIICRFMLKRISTLYINNEYYIFLSILEELIQNHANFATAHFKFRISVRFLSYIFDTGMYSRSKKKKKKHYYLFQYVLSYRNETDTNHHGFVPTSV